MERSCDWQALMCAMTDLPHGAMVVCDLYSGEVVEERTERTTVKFYIPTYLATEALHYGLDRSY